MTEVEDWQRVHHEAEARAARNGLTLEVGDREAGPSWPGKRWLSLHLMRGREQVAGCAQTYTEGDERSKFRALSISAERVYNRPIEG